MPSASPKYLLSDHHQQKNSNQSKIHATLYSSRIFQLVICSLTQIKKNIFENLNKTVFDYITI